MVRVCSQSVNSSFHAETVFCAAESSAATIASTTPLTYTRTRSASSSLASDAKESYFGLGGVNVDPATFVALDVRLDIVQIRIGLLLDLELCHLLWWPVLLL